MNALVEEGTQMSSSASSSFISPHNTSHGILVDDGLDGFVDSSRRRSSPGGLASTPVRTAAAPHHNLHSGGGIANHTNNQVRGPLRRAGSGAASGADEKTNTGDQQTGFKAAANVNHNSPTTASQVPSVPTFRLSPLAQPRRHVDPVAAESPHKRPMTTSSNNAAGRLAAAQSPLRGLAPSTNVAKSTNVAVNLADASTAESYAEMLTNTYLSCAICQKVVCEPVQLMPNNLLACRQCGGAAILRGAATIMHEYPAAVTSALQDIFNRSSRSATSTSAALQEGAAAISKRRPAPAAQSKRIVSKSQGPLWSRELSQVREAESTERSQIVRSETAEWFTFEKGVNQQRTTKTTISNRVAGSKQIKTEADKKYENAEYTAAVELYNRAIQLQPVDKQTQLKFLYGNRSAAHFMAQRYADCVADCLEAVRLEPGNTKMLARAARSSATMGDLEQAVRLLSSVPPQSLPEANQSDLAKYKAGVELFKRAERGFGTHEGDECYRMLVAQFSDTIPFRIRLAESLRHQRHYKQATDVLEVVSSGQRLPLLCVVMADCLYRTGFEHFDRARKVLQESAQFDDDCAALLQRINVVDDGKQRGNTAFAEKNFAQAVEHYTSAIQLAEDNDQILRILYCNRAAAHKEVGKYREGVDDCTKAIALNNDFFKAYARRGRCHQLLGDHFAAVQDFKKALQYDSADRDLQRELRDAEYSLSKEKDREKDFYYQLGLTRTATERDIKAKYRELSLRWHPDKCVSLNDAERERAEHKFKVISEAYITLIDAGKRREYDMNLDHNQFSRGGFGFGSTFSGGDIFRGNTRTRSGGKYW